MYGVNMGKFVFEFTREDSYGQPVYKISKIGTQMAIKLGYVSIEGLLQAELSIAKCYARKNPSIIFKNYIDAMNAKINNRLLNLYDNSKFYSPFFIDEMLSNFTALFKYDLGQALGVRDIDLFPAQN